MSGLRSVAEGIGPALDSTLPSPGGRAPTGSGEDDPFDLKISRGALIVRREPGGCTLDLIVDRDEAPAVDQALTAWADRRGLTEATDAQGPGVIARDRYAAGRGRLRWNIEIGAKASEPTFVRVEWRLKG